MARTSSIVSEVSPVDPYIGIIADIYCVELDLSFHLRVILSHPMNRLLSRMTNFIFILDF